MDNQVINNSPNKVKRMRFSLGLIQNTGYFEDIECLEISLHDGTIYHFFDVPSEIYTDLLSSDDPDEYYRKNIRNKFKRLFKRFSFWD
ncbi:MAG: KTSC domain-containing protein [Bacteroidales bacterium]|nr:KTSC domain-containing protein [Bacteroidales bacterium]